MLDHKTLFLTVMSLLYILLYDVSRDSDAFPIKAPDLQRCETAIDRSLIGPAFTATFNCCLQEPPLSKIRDFSFQTYPAVHKRVRVPAHRAAPDQIAKYELAYQRLRALPEDDPRSWAGQYKLHCAMCNAAYNQAGVGARGDVQMQIHFSWLFLPWHRWYLYFHERILSSLIDDPTFSLVYWNWDDQSGAGGNLMPDMFTRNVSSALYDANRDYSHLPPSIVPLIPSNNTTSNLTLLIQENLNSMYKSVVAASTPQLFLGGAYRVGTDLANNTVLDAPLGGALENTQHDAVHHWTGDPRLPLAQDMGTFSTAARDPLFFTHHGNLDRLWALWKTLPGGLRRDHDDVDFLEAEFIFYDEDANLVKVKIKDALDSDKLGVEYDPGSGDELWLGFRSESVKPNVSMVEYAESKGVQEVDDVVNYNGGAVEIHDKLSVIVKRNVINVSDPEVLEIQELQVATRHEFLQLLVFVNLPDADRTTRATCAEYVGAFHVMPISSPRNQRLSVNAQFEIGDSLRQIGLQNEERIVVTIIVKPSGSQISIKGIRISDQL